MLKRGFVDIPDGQVHYRAAGDGPPIILLHPTPMSSKLYRGLIEALSPSFRAIGMDTMGFGDSDRPSPAYTSLDQYAQSIVWFAQALGYERFHLLGHQTGAQIALQTAARFPANVESLVVLEPFNWGTPERRAVHERLHRFHERKADGSHLLELWNHYPPRGDLKRHEEMFKDRLAANEIEGAEVYGEMGWEGSATWSMCRVDVWTITPLITSPTLVAYTPNSERIRAYERFMTTIPNAQGTKEAPNLGDNPEGLAKMVTEFIGSIRG